MRKLRDNIHKIHLRTLESKSDWAGLVRYWIGHDHEAALSRALVVARRTKARRLADRRALTRFLARLKEDPLAPNPAPSAITSGITPSERATFSLLALYPLAHLCIRQTGYPNGLRQTFLRMGTDAAMRLADLGRTLADWATTARFRAIQGFGLKELGELKSARVCLQEAQGTYRRLTRSCPALYQYQLACTLNDLGNVEGALGDWDVALPRLGEALKLFGQMAQDCPAGAGPEIPHVLQNLGNVHTHLGHWELARSFYQEAVAAFRELAVEQPHTYELPLASTLEKLAELHTRLGEFQDACTSFVDALTVYDRLEKQDPGTCAPQVAALLNDFACLEFELQEVRAAKAHFRQALTAYRELAKRQPAVYGPALACTYLLLAQALIRCNNLKGAATSADKALRTFQRLDREQPRKYKGEIAFLLFNLGYVEWLADDVARASKTLRQALGAFRALFRKDQEICRPDLTVTLITFAEVHMRLNDAQRARAAYAEAIRRCAEDHVSSRSACLQDRSISYTKLGRLLREGRPPLFRPDYGRAIEVLRKARRCAELFRGKFQSVMTRRHLLAQSLAVYELLVHTCVDLWEENRNTSLLREAVEVAEAIRARQLAELLHDEPPRPVKASPKSIERLLGLQRRLAQATLSLATEEQRVLRGKLVGPFAKQPEPVPLGQGRGLDLSTDRLGRTQSNQPNKGSWLVSLRTARNRLDSEYRRALGHLKRADPECDPDSPVRPVSYKVVQELIPRDLPTALIQFTLTAAGAVALVITPREVQPVRLPGFGRHQAWKLAQEWITAYQQCRSKPVGEFLHEFDRTVRQSVSRLGQEVMTPLLKELPPDTKRLVFALHQALHVFPWHACTLEADRFLADEFDVVYTPSCSLLYRCALRSQRTPGPFLLVENPTGDLPFAVAECAAVRRREPLKTLRLACGEVQKRRFLRAVVRSGGLYYSGHGEFSSRNPLDSALIFASRHTPAEWLTLREVFTRLRLHNHRITILNGCESGFLSPDVTDDYQNFTTGFLFAGARCVISTLWAISDLSSALLMDRFHAEWLAGRSPSSALREAQRWLRQDITSGSQLVHQVMPSFLASLRHSSARELCEETARAYAQKFPDQPPFASPVHWAAFTANGLAYPLNAIKSR